MPSPNSAESLPCARGGVTALRRDGGVILVETIPQSPLYGDSLLDIRGPVHTTSMAGGYDCCFGPTVFSKKVLKEVTNKVI